MLAWVIGGRRVDDAGEMNTAADARCMAGDTNEAVP